MGYKSNELYHYGKKGMKWGVRRYQNKDGTLTAAGKKRYDRDVRENNAKKKDNRAKIDGPDPDRWVKEDMSRSKKVLDETGKTLNEIDNVRSTAAKNKAKKVDLSSMSDQELRDRINRANLERQYSNLIAEDQVTISRGRQIADNVIQYGGGALAIGSSALGIALAIKELRG